MPCLEFLFVAPLYAATSLLLHLNHSVCAPGTDTIVPDSVRASRSLKQALQKPLRDTDEITKDSDLEHMQWLEMQIEKVCMPVFLKSDHPLRG